jgi:hypothetical protein
MRGDTLIKALNAFASPRINVPSIRGRSFVSGRYRGLIGGIAKLASLSVSPAKPAQPV